jgi:hypothetical protein
MSIHINEIKITDWIRWLLFLPSSIASYFATFYIVMILNLFIPNFIVSMDMNNILDYIVIKGLAHGWSAVAFIWVGATIAPRYNFIVSIIMAALYTLALGFMLTMKIIYGSTISTPWLEIIIMLITGIIAIVGVVNYFKIKND